jgi:hypothetical protein
LLRSKQPQTKTIKEGVADAPFLNIFLKCFGGKHGCAALARTPFRGTYLLHMSGDNFRGSDFSSCSAVYL